ncbi:myb-like protein N [Leguminivora glycinivorella]|uniref:myb-like protein N n=1 Tax=Leguminivora glycinivorella TaxID=1035111 RepID=UPI00200E44ED|nr:myb-like protein N [Leguminivora glycinivorella]
MEIDSETENEILRDLARLQLCKVESSADKSVLPGEYVDNGHAESASWTNPPSREARELIVAEEILRFASHATCLNTKEVQPDSQLTFVTASNETKKSDKSAEHLTSEVTNGVATPAVNQATTKSTRIVSDAGTSGSQPLQSENFELSPPLIFNSPDTCFPVRGATFSIGPQLNSRPYCSPAFKPNIVPVTNSILAAIAQNKLERPMSSTPETLQPSSNADMSQYWPRDSAQLFTYFIHYLKLIQGSDMSESSSPDSEAPPRSLSPSIHDSNEDISSLNKNMLLINKLEEMITKNLQKGKDGTGVETVQEGNDKPHPRKVTTNLNVDENNINKEEVVPQEGTSGLNNRNKIPLGCVDANNTYDRKLTRKHIENIVSVNRGVGDSSGSISQSEYPEENESRGQWTRQEKQRLGIVIRDFSRSIKTKELQKKRARLFKKARIIAQAIENKICDIDREIMDVNKKPLRLVALPLDQIQEYDWAKVASVLNAKRTSEECRMHWKSFLHPSINNGEWTLIEARAMQIIAQRHNFRNWDDIAEELNTGRSGYQCYLFFRKNLCPHLQLRGQYNKK